MADFEVKKSSEDVSDGTSDTRIHTAEATNKGESLEDLLTMLSKQIKNNSSEWLKENTAEKFAIENPEVAEAFKNAASKSCQDRNGDKGDSV